MKIVILGLLIFSGVLLLYYPQINEDVSGSCAALERQLIRSYQQHRKEEVSVLEKFMLGGVQSFSNGVMASRVVKEEYPEFPPSVGCVVLYWRMLFSDDHGFDVHLESK